MKRFLPPLLLIVFPCLLLWPVLGGGVLLPAHLLRDVYPWRTGNPNDLVPWNPLQFDGIVQFYPWRLFTSETLRAGFIPLWNPYEFCGTPFLANSQSAVLYPPNLIFEIVKPMYAFGISAIVHLSATGIFLYAFIRRALGLNRSAALAGAVVWQLSTWQVSWLALPTFLDTSAWFPLALLLAQRLAAKPSASRAALLGATLGVMLLAGHLQIALYGFLLTAAYAIYRVVSERVRFPAAIACALLTLLVAFAVASPQLLPAVELSRVSHRATEKPSAAGYAGYVRLATPPYQLATLYMPSLFGRPGDRADSPNGEPYNGENAYWGATNYAENACYVGIATLILVLIGLVSQFRMSGYMLFFAVLGVVALAIALGSPIDRLLYFGVPGFSQTGSPARIDCLWAISAAILAAFGMQAVSTCRPRFAAPLAAFVGIGAALSVIAIAILGSANAGGGGAAPVISLIVAQIRVPAALSIAVVAVFWLRRKGTLTVAAMQGLLVALIAVDLLGVNFGYNTIVTAKQVYQKTPAIDWLIAHAQSVRIMPANSTWSLFEAPPAIMPPNTATVYRLKELQGYDSLQTGAYKSFAAQMNGGQDPSPRENGNIVFTHGKPGSLSELAGAGYIVCPPFEDTAGAVYAGSDAVIFADPLMKQRANGVSSSEVKVIDVSPTRVDIWPTSAGNVVLADQWYPGWHAYQGGHGVTISRGPDVFRTVNAISNKRIEMRYEPEAFRMGLYFALAAVACLAMLAALRLTARAHR